MAEVRPFRALRFDSTRAGPAVTIAPPYDVISAEQQSALYERSPYNIVRVEYGAERPSDTESDNRYTRAANDLRAWRDAGVLTLDGSSALYAYRQEFQWGARAHVRHAVFAAVRLEEWSKGIIKPHEHTLANPKADRLKLLRATRTQVSPVYSLYRPRAGAPPAPALKGPPIVDVAVDDQRHTVVAITDRKAIDAFAATVAASDVYIADGHHRYETALAYRDEIRLRAASWTGDEPENFVLMALTDAADPGLLVLPTHRLITPPSFPSDALARIAQRFRIDEIVADVAESRLADAAARAAAGAETAFVDVGLAPSRAHLLTLADRAAVEALMPADQPDAWKRLDVNVLQYGILRDVFGIDDAALAAGGAVAYTQDAQEARDAVASGRARVAFLLNATPVAHVIAVADANARMPQKSTYFYPKLPTGLVLRPLD